MEKAYHRYFGKNIATILYILSAILAIIGLVITFFRWWHYGFLLTIVGAVIFVITFRMKITDHDLDSKLLELTDKYKENQIRGTVVNKKVLDENEFDLFSGYVFDSTECKAKVGADGKLRTSHMFITAVRTDKKDFQIFYSLYDLFHLESPNHQFLTSEGIEVLSVESSEIKIPHGMKKHCIRYSNSDGEYTFQFYAKDDALMDELLARISSRIN